MINFKRLFAIVVLTAFVFGISSCKKEDPIALPTVKVFEGAITIDYTKATVSAEVTDQGGAEVTKKGFIYGKSGGAQDTIVSGSGTGVFSAELLDLEPNVTYTYEAFARNAGGTALSGKVTFTTREPILPTVKTVEVGDVTTGTATCSGKVTDDGGATVTKRGVCWRKSHNPTIDNDHAESGEGLGDYQCELTGLEENTTYYVRAFATNSKGTSYGEELTFTTLDFNMPRVTTASASNITPTTAQGGGNVTDDGGTDITERGVCWGTSHNPTTADSHVAEGADVGSFTCEITELFPHTKYYMRAYAINSKGTSYGEEVSFTTLATPPTVFTGSVTNITTTTAKGGGNVTDDGGATVTSRGICWSRNHNPTVSSHHASSGTGTGSFTVDMTDLVSNATYYVRAYAINSQGTTYGEEVEFTTNPISKPTVTTASVTDINTTTAKGGGNVTDDGGAEVTERGICWGTSHNPSTNNTHAASGTGTGSYTVNMTGLSSNTTYYVRAYATNSKGTSYGAEVEFKTLNIGKPTVITLSVTDITSTTAKGGGNVTNDGNATVTERGICWSSSHNPTISNHTATSGTGTGSFTANMTGLSANTTYYVRAYATNNQGTSYGEEVSFQTASIAPPTVTTVSVSNVTATSAQLSGRVDNAGGAAVTARGFCYGKSPNPSLGNTHTNDGTGTGNFSSTLTGLLPNTTYYVRAYATNSGGTSYGSQMTFTTINNMATIVLTAGNVWNDGTGYQMLLDANANTYGSTIPESGALSSNCSGNESIYAMFEYKLPVSADGVCTTQNIVINSTCSILIPAGTYDWCITNPTPNDRIWIAGSNGSIGGRYDDFVFEAGKTYTFEPKKFGEHDGVDLTVTDSGKSIVHVSFKKPVNQSNDNR